MRFENVNIDGLNIFYREAGDESAETCPSPRFSGFVTPVSGPP